MYSTSDSFLTSRTAIWFEVCSLNTRFPELSVSTQYGLDTGDFITPVTFPYDESGGSVVLYFVNCSDTGLKRKKKLLDVSTIQTSPF